jgi:hypothetical protein
MAKHFVEGDMQIKLRGIKCEFENKHVTVTYIQESPLEIVYKILSSNFSGYYIA